MGENLFLELRLERGLKTMPTFSLTEQRTARVTIGNPNPAALSCTVRFVLGAAPNALTWDSPQITIPAKQTGAIDFPIKMSDRGEGTWPVSIHVYDLGGNVILSVQGENVIIAAPSLYESFVNQLLGAKDYSDAFVIVKDFAQAAAKMLISDADYNSLYLLYLHLPLRQQYASLYDFYVERLLEAYSYSSIMAVMYDFTNATRSGQLSAEDYFKLYDMFQHHWYLPYYGVGSNIYTG